MDTLSENEKREIRMQLVDVLRWNARHAGGTLRDLYRGKLWEIAANAVEEED